MRFGTQALAADSPALRLVRLQGFEAPFSMQPEAHDAYLRRFATLLADETSARRGGNAQVIRVMNAWGEQFALKILTREGEEAQQAFRHEYELQRRLSGLKGFPRLYGWAFLDGAPVIVMEWIEGIPLSRARRELAVDEAGRLSPLTAARIGRDLFDLLARMGVLEGQFAHRDLSPENILVRTSRLPLAAQVQEGTFDLCLIDFGSAAQADDEAKQAFSTGAVGAYAAPELLPGAPDRARRKGNLPAVDVFAAASMLYELACGRLPFACDQGSAAWAWQTKASGAYEPMTLAHRAAPDIVGVLNYEPEVAVVVGIAASEFSLTPDAGEVREALALVDLQLEELIGAGLAVPASDRPSAAALRDALATFCFQYADNVGRALRGERLVDCLSGGPASGFGGSPVRLRNFMRTMGKSASAAVWGVSVVATGLLAHGSHAALSLGQLSWEGDLGGATISLALALPALIGYALRGKEAHSQNGFVRGSIALLACASAVAFLELAATISPEGVAHGLAAALLASTAAAWCPLVVDFALATLPARRRKMLTAAAERHALKAGAKELPAGGAALDAGEGEQALGGATAEGADACALPQAHEAQDREAHEHDEARKRKDAE